MRNQEGSAGHKKDLWVLTPEVPSPRLLDPSTFLLVLSREE